MFFDSHAHYYDERFYGDENPQGAESLLEQLFNDGLLGVINIGTSVQSSRAAIEQAKKFPLMYAAVGIHPEELAHVEQPIDLLVAAIRDMADRRKNGCENKVVAIGEIGLDYYWKPYDRGEQIRCFEAQLRLAGELDLPVIIHDREAHGDCFETVLKYPGIKGVFHSFSGSAEMARELTRRGWYISFSGVVSFKNAVKAKEVAAIVPDDKMLVETDAPYLTPHPFRGKLNHSGRLLYTATAIAEARGCSVEEVARLTRDNTKALFGI